MADIQPKNTDTIRVNGISEKTAASSISLNNITLVDDVREKTGGHGVYLNSILKATTSLIPLTATVNLGTSTVAEHILKAFMKALASSGQNLTISTDSAHDISISLNASNVWKFIQSSANLENDVSNGGDIVFNRSDKGVCHNGNAAFTTLGTTQGTAAPTLTTVTVITTCVAGVTDGALLPVITAATLWKPRWVANESGAAGKVYPNTGANIDDGAANASFALADNTHKMFMPITTTRWLSF